MVQPTPNDLYATSLELLGAKLSSYKGNQVS